MIASIGRHLNTRLKDYNDRPEPMCALLPRRGLLIVDSQRRGRLGNLAEWGSGARAQALFGQTDERLSGNADGAHLGAVASVDERTEADKPKDNDP